MESSILIEELLKAGAFLIILYTQMLIAIVITTAITLVITWGIHFTLLPFGIDTRRLGESAEAKKLGQAVEAEKAKSGLIKGLKNDTSER